MHHHLLSSFSVIVIPSKESEQATNKKIQNFLMQPLYIDNQYNTIKNLTFKDLRRRIYTNQETLQNQSSLYERIKNKPFSVWNIVEQHRQEDLLTKGDRCCLNHIIEFSTKEK